MNYRKFIEEYFSAEERGDVEAVAAMCDEGVTIRNAAQPPQHGKDGAREYVSTFKDRTDERKFRVLAIAQDGDTVFAWWDASLTFKAGIAFGPIVTKRPFTVQLQGVCRFKMSASGRFDEIDVFHETTSPVHLAQEAATTVEA